jgi:Zn-dependent M16 (insulinase) family peptidase
MEALKSEDAQFWVTLLRTYLLGESRPHVVVNARPSVDLRNRRAEAERDRVASRRLELGDHGLLDKEKTLEKARAANKVK